MIIFVVFSFFDSFLLPIWFFSLLFHLCFLSFFLVFTTFFLSLAFFVSFFLCCPWCFVLFFPRFFLSIFFCFSFFCFPSGLSVLIIRVSMRSISRTYSSQTPFKYCYFIFIWRGVSDETTFVDFSCDHTLCCHCQCLHIVVWFYWYLGGGPWQWCGIIFFSWSIILSYLLGFGIPREADILWKSSVVAMSLLVIVIELLITQHMHSTYTGNTYTYTLKHTHTDQYYYYILPGCNPGRFWRRYTDFGHIYFWRPY